MPNKVKAAIAQMLVACIGIVSGLIWVGTAEGWNLWLAWSSLALAIALWCWGAYVALWTVIKDHRR